MRGMSVRKKDPESRPRSKVLVLVDESNVGSSVRTAGRGLDWLKLRDFLAGPNTGRANVDVMMAIDAVELSIEMRPDAVILVTGDADFAYLAIKLRRHGIRVEVASVAANLGQTLRSAANEVIDLAPLFRTFEIMKAQDAPPSAQRPPQQQHRRRRPRFRAVQPRDGGGDARA